MAETVEFKSNGNQASGYLAKPASGSGPGVLLIQEWWGLDDSLKEMADRLAAKYRIGPGTITRVVRGLEKAITQKVVTYDFARLMEGATEVSCSAFGDAIIKNL